jgi:hypothetical protein
MSVGEGPDGELIVGTSEPKGYLRPGVREEVTADEDVADGHGHGEQNVVGRMMERGFTSGTVGAGRPICAMCAETIWDNGFEIGSPLKEY